MNEDSKPFEEALHDTDRVNYYSGNLDALLRAVVQDGVVIKSYFPWSFMDNFEW